ncbi:MAG: DUF429 domain-containing protein [Candidatus Asgardarchaeia archaeon]
MITIAGIDLAGSEKNVSGLAKLKVVDIDSSKVLASLNVKKAKSDDEIINFCEDADIIAIDSPLTLPTEENAFSRKLDKEMTKKGYRVFPTLFGGMKKLTYRAMRLKEEFVSKGKVVIEVHPRSSLKKLQLTHQDIFSYLKLNEKLSKDETDAVICALTGFAYFLNEVEKIEAEDGVLYLPSSSFKDIIPLISVV